MILCYRACYNVIFRFLKIRRKQGEKHKKVPILA
nr:MAG TPA: hypothetical protein [Caudoviricetes sp.]